METDAFKIWRNPTSREEAPVYLGDFYPPEGQVCFFASDLKTLGFDSGQYTIRVPDSLRQLYALPPWLKVEIQ